METVFSTWKFDSTKGELRSDPQIWNFPPSMRNEILKLYAWFAVPTSIIAIPLLFVFPPVFNYSEYYDLFGPTRFYYKLLASIGTYIGCFFLYFWPLLLSFRKPVILYTMAGALHINDKKIPSREILQCGVQRKTFFSRSGPSTFLVLTINFLDGSDFSQIFSTSSEKELKNFIEFLGEKLQIKTQFLQSS